MRNADLDARTMPAATDAPILCVTTNPAIDITYTLDAISLGESHRVPTGLARAGGKGVNVARVLRQRGEHALVIAPIGGPVQSLFVHDLVEADIPHRIIEVTAPTRRTTAIVTPSSTTNLNERGAPIETDDWRRVLDAVREHAPAARVVVSSGSLPPGSPDGLCARVVELAHAAGKPVIVDCSGPQLPAAVAAGAHAAKPNRHELLDAMGGTDPLDAARRLAALGTGIVFASLDVEGMLAVDRSGRALHARLDVPLEGNPTGAGDAAVAALAHTMAAGATLEEQLVRATAWSAAAVLEPQAGSIGDVEALLPRIRVAPIG